MQVYLHSRLLRLILGGLIALHAVLPVTARSADLGESVLNFVESSLEQLIGQTPFLTDRWGGGELELGYDSGPISKVILSLGRTVQQNPVARNDSERFLVRDEFVMGLRLGYGFVVSGDVSFVRKYTLTYPVKSRWDGTLSRKFIFDLLLAKRAHFGPLPATYVMTIEDTMEGRGRLNLGGTVDIPIGLDMSASRIDMGRLVIAADPSFGHKLIVDQILKTRLALELYVGLYFLEIPIMRLSGEMGRHKQKLYHVRPDENGKAVPEYLRRFFWQTKLEKIAPYASELEFDSKFKQIHYSFGFLGLVDRDFLARKDRFNIQGSQYDQFTSSSFKKWYFPGTGEKHWHELVVQNKTTPDGRHELYGRIIFNVTDYRTRFKEWSHAYEPFLQEWSAQSLDFVLPSMWETNHHNLKIRKWGTMNLFGETHYYKEGLQRLLELSEEQVWQALARTTEQEHWSDPRFRAMFKRHPFKYRQQNILAKSVERFLKKLKKTREEEKPAMRALYLKQAINKLIKKDGQTFNGVLLGLLTELTREDNFLKAQVTIQRKRERHLPGEPVLKLSTGEDRREDYLIPLFLHHDMTYLWNALIP